MDIGTAKPSVAARRGVPFHLIDIRDPAASMSVKDFVREADAAEADVLARGRVPIFAGGTALYVKALVEGLFEGPAADWDLRRRLEAEAAEHGPEALHERLATVDPKTAARLHPRDLRRVIRALEVHEKTGRPIADLQRQWSDDAFGGAEAASAPPRRTTTILGLLWPRDVLNRRIDERVDRMMAAGFEAEARALLARPGGIGREAAQALGYREMLAFIRGEIPDLAAAVALVKRNTRRFARRQITFFKRFRAIRWLPVDDATDPERLAEAVVREHFAPRPLSS
jgi:tRNA dimethylallyltransferase